MLSQLDAWDLWKEDFSRRLGPREFPVTRVLATEVSIPSLRVGIIREDGTKAIFEVTTEAIRDPRTDEFVAAVCTARDITKISEEMKQMREADDERFRVICDTMPQMVLQTCSAQLARHERSTHWPHH